MIVHPVDFPLGSLAARKSTGWTIERTAETTPRAWFDGGADWHGDRGRHPLVGSRSVRSYANAEQASPPAWRMFTSSSSKMNLLMWVMVLDVDCSGFFVADGSWKGFFAFSSGATLAVAIVALLVNVLLLLSERHRWDWPYQQMKGTQHSDRNFPFHPRLQKPRCALHFPPCVWKAR